MSKPANTKIKWVIYHEPIDLFLRTANAFSKEIEKLTDGRIQIEVYTENEYSKKFLSAPNSSDADVALIFDPISLLQNNDVQMSQVYTAKLGENRVTDFYALDLPFLFRDHDHASTVLEGDIGQALLGKTLPEKIDVRGLAFTYSGGFRVMASSRKIKTAEDLKGLTLGHKWNPVFDDLARCFGCEPHLLLDNTSSEDRRKLATNYDTVHTTLPRYFIEADNNVHQYVTNTQHSLFLTVIVIGETFWNSLSVEDQLHMKTAAFNSARLERKWTVEDAEKISSSVDEQRKLGMREFINFPLEETQKLKQSVKPLYEKYKKFFSAGLVDKIIKS